MTCYICNEECNPSSQACSRCLKKISGYAISEKYISNRDRIIKALSDIKVGHNTAIVYDIDGTLLEYDGGLIDDINDTYQYARDRGFALFIVTARSDDEYVIKMTHEQLQKNNIIGYEAIYFRPNLEQDIEKYKTLSRKNITEKGYNIVASIGDTDWDIGQYGGMGFLI